MAQRWQCGFLSMEPSMYCPAPAAHASGTMAKELLCLAVVLIKRPLAPLEKQREAIRRCWQRSFALHDTRFSDTLPRSIMCLL